jgi:transcriptional regulator with XRE-family HTH domain
MEEKDPLVEWMGAFKRASGKTWLEIAEEMRVGSTNLVNVAKGLHDPSIRLIQKIARHLQWGPVEVGQVMLFEGRGRKKK